MVVVFDCWLTISTRAGRAYRVAVWRRMRCGRSAPWSAAERALIGAIGRAEA